MKLPTLTTSRCTLDPLPGALADGPPAAPGWPHENTPIVLHAAAELGWPTWLIRLTATGEVFGDCGLKGPPGPSGEVEIGYGLAAPLRGQGYATEAVGAVVDWLRTQPDVGLVTAEVSPDNLPSRRLLERLRFEISRTNDRYVYYARKVSEEHPRVHPNSGSSRRNPSLP